MDKLDMKSMDVIAENIRKLGEVFPECVVEATDPNGGGVFETSH